MSTVDETFEPENNVALWLGFCFILGYFLFFRKNDPDKDVKMVLIIRTDLHMRTGKIIAQCGHGAVAGYKSAVKHPKLLKAWENEGQKKISLQVDGEFALKELWRQAKSVGLLANIIYDAGGAQIAAGTPLICAIGPGPSSLIDKVTGYLHLF